ncbi:hypothetical protein [Bradyrhizobium sp. LB12.1]|uniref:hypothetical protein n=1 Tax=unclassified Bradyrhizobium TaxID=2631580 RepID=UPI003398974F
MAGSADRKMLRTRNSPSEILGTSVSRSAKSVGCGIPLGRELSHTCRFFIAAAFLSHRALGGRTARFGPVDHRLALGEEPGAVVLHELVQVTHSIVLSDGNALNVQRKIFLCLMKNRLTDPSETFALDFKHQFRRSTICSVFSDYRRRSVDFL